MKNRGKYQSFIEGLATPLETRHTKRYPAKPSMFSNNAQIWHGPFHASLNQLLDSENYALTMVENKYTGRAKLYIRETEMRLLGMVRLPDSRRDDYMDYTVFWLEYWIPEKWQFQVLAPEDYGLSDIPDVELLAEYNRRNPIPRKKPKKPSAEIVDFQRYLEQLGESRSNLTTTCGLTHRP